VPEPSIKGTIFAPVAEEVQALRESGRLSEEKLAVALQPEDLGYLDNKLLTASWYPIATYARYLDLLGEVEGEGDRRYFERRGHMSAQRLLDAGMYSQLDIIGDLASRTVPGADDPDGAQTLSTYRKKLAVVLSLTGTIYNCGQWKVVDDPQDAGRVMIEIRDCAAYSDGMVGAIVGFLDRCAQTVSRDVDKLYEFDRPAKDFVRIRMTEGLIELRRRINTG